MLVSVYVFWRDIASSIFPIKIVRLIFSGTCTHHDSSAAQSVALQVATGPRKHQMLYNIKVSLKYYLFYISSNCNSIVWGISAGIFSIRMEVLCQQDIIRCCQTPALSSATKTTSVHPSPTKAKPIILNIFSLVIIIITLFRIALFILIRHRHLALSPSHPSALLHGFPDLHACLIKPSCRVQSAEPLQ